LRRTEGLGAWENRKKEEYRSSESMGEVGILKGWEVGEIGRNYAKMLYIFFFGKGLMGGTQEVRDGNWQSNVPEVGGLDLLVLRCSPLPLFTH